MLNAKYPRKRFLELLGLTEKALQKLETEGELSKLGGPSEEYGPPRLSAYRETLNCWPSKYPRRRQLFLNFKGGTGKTSLSVSYAHRLAELGHKVLLIDLDSQGHATKCLGYEGDDYEQTLYDILVKKVPITDIRVKTTLSQLHLIPSNLRMATVDLALMPLSNREHRLKRALSAVENEYDFIVMDAPPAFGLLNLNAIMAANDLYVPVLPDFLSFHGLKLLFETLDDIQEDMEHRLDRIFVIINQFNPTTKIARAARDALMSHYPEYVLPDVVRQCTKFAQASSEGTPIFMFDPRSKGALDIQNLFDTTLMKSSENRSGSSSSSQGSPQSPPASKPTEAKPSSEGNDTNNNQDTRSHQNGHATSSASANVTSQADINLQLAADLIQPAPKKPKQTSKGANAGSTKANSTVSLPTKTKSDKQGGSSRQKKAVQGSKTSAGKKTVLQSTGIEAAE